MNIDINSIKYIKLFDVSYDRDGGIIVNTPFIYADGTYVDVFVVEKDSGFVVTDRGEAIGWLKIQSLDGKLSDLQLKFIQDIAITHGVSYKNGEISSKAAKEDLHNAILNVSQAAAKVTNAWICSYKSCCGMCEGDEDR
jgi:hypothetical protein